MWKWPDKFRISSFQWILGGFLAVILAGTGLLMLPAASASGQAALFSEALFTAASAVCVTGLVVRDTATFWSPFGKSVILLLIQTGGLGVVTMATLLTVLAGRPVSLRQKSILKDSVSAFQTGGIIRFTRFMLLVTLGAETVGALCMFPVFAGEFGPAKGAGMAVFHSVSAFCNAGFDLMGERAAFSSLTWYADSVPVNLTIMGLIIVGGIGFHTMEEMGEHRFHISRYSLQSKMILAAGGLLMFIPAVLFWFFEYEGLPAAPRLLASLFQSVTTRTAGFNTMDFGKMSEPAQLLVILLMITGGAPGSTAGGIKTTTVAVLAVSAVSVFRRRDTDVAFGRRIPVSAVRNAAAILAVYGAVFLLTAALICRAEHLSLLPCMFEAASAIGTVGLSLGITPGLGTFSRMLLVFLMIFGRVGGLTLVYAAIPSVGVEYARYPEESVNVG